MGGSGGGRAPPRRAHTQVRERRIRTLAHSLVLLHPLSNPAVLNQKRGMVFEEMQRPGTPMYNIKAYLPVIESFGFTAVLRAATSGQAFPQCVFDHWEMMQADPLQTGSQAATIVADIRKRKGIKPEVQPLSEYEDKVGAQGGAFVWGTGAVWGAGACKGALAFSRCLSTRTRWACRAWCRGRTRGLAMHLGCGGCLRGLWCVVVPLTRSPH